MTIATQHVNIPIFVPELACPNRCVFCNQFKISGSLSQPSETEIINQIEIHLDSISKIKKSVKVEVAFFGGNFTGIPIEIQENYLKLVQPYILSEKIHGIRLSTRPDYIDENKLELLKKYHVTAIEIGVQSLDNDVLELSGRGHNAAHVDKAVKLINRFGFELGLQMMIGLPGDTKEKTLKTALEIISYKPNTVRIYPTLVIDNTELATLFRKKIYKALTIEEAIDWTKQIYLFFELNRIKVIRTGLHPSEEFNNGTSLLAGPYHMSFKELVLSAIWFDIFNSYKFDFSEKNVTIAVSNKEINYAIGYQSKNKNWLKNRFNKVSFVCNSSLTNRSYEIYYC